MAKISDIVKVTISKQTAQITTAGFGTPAIIGEFPANKTSPNFDRHAYYATTEEMVDAGWITTDEMYLRVQKLFSQEPRPDRVMVGRKKPESEAVETWTEALTAISDASLDWYMFTLIPTQSAKVVFDIDFVASNSIVFTINGVSVTAVPFNSDQATTMADIITQIETDIVGSSVILDPTDLTDRTLIIEIESSSVSTASVIVTGGVSQPVGTVTLITEDDVEEIAGWTQTQKKIFFHTSDDPDIITSSSADIGSILKLGAYSRSAINYHPQLSSDQYFSEAYAGRGLPFDPGSSTWNGKTLSAINTYNLSSGERTFALDKNVNIYTLIAGLGYTEEGKTASGEWIDIMRGIDWLEARLGEKVFSELAKASNSGSKIPYTDGGVQIIVGFVKEILELAVRNGVLASYEVTFPKVSEVPEAEKLARNLPDIKFTGILAGAIHTVEIDGLVSV